MIAKLVKSTKVDREEGYIYFIDDEGHIARTSELNPPGKKQKIQIVKRVGFKKEPGYAYFLDSKGNIRKVFLDKENIKVDEVLKKQKLKKKK